MLGHRLIGLQKILVEKFKKETKEEQKQTVTNVTYDPNNPNDQRLLAQKGLHIDPTSKKITMTQSSTGEIKEVEVDKTPRVRHLSLVCVADLPFSSCLWEATKLFKKMKTQVRRRQTQIT